MEFFTMHFEVQILVIWNNHEYGVLMNCKVKCVENPSRNSECMHMKCKFVLIVVWNNFVGIKFHFYHLVTILWGNFVIVMWNNFVEIKFSLLPFGNHLVGNFFFYFPYNNEKVFLQYLLLYYRWKCSDKWFYFSIKNLEGYVKKYKRFKELTP
jgi:hypothetical protein